MHDRLVINLDKREVERVGEGAAQRDGWHASRSGDLRGNNGVLDTMDLNVVGCAGELAVCNHLGVEWHGKYYEGGRGCPDLGVDVEVKTSRHNENLLINLDDERDRRYISCWLNGWSVRIQGWIPGAVAMQNRWKASKVPGRWGYFFPADLLNPMSTWVQEGLLWLPPTSQSSEAKIAAWVLHLAALDG